VRGVKRSDNPALVAREKALWVEYGLTGPIVPDAILKECQRRLRDATPGSDLESDLKKDLQSLDELHQFRKQGSDTFAQAYPVGVWKDVKAVEPSESTRSKGRHFWAVVIGNDSYPECPLRGCINDADLVHDFLISYLNVPGDHIRILQDASRETMVNTLYDLRDDPRIRHGDNILIHFSGHGSSYRAADFFTSDVARASSIEAICPVDRSDKIPDISERELCSILSEIHTAKGPNITLIFDCCHSGGALRALDVVTANLDGAVRYVAPVGGKKGILMMFKAAEEHPRRRPSSGTLTSEDWVVDVSPFVQQLAACQDFQLARESNFTGDHGGNSNTSVRQNWGRHKEQPSSLHGCFTWALMKLLKSEEGKNATYESVITQIGRLGPMQVPVGFGSRRTARLWFGEPEVRN